MKIIITGNGKSGSWKIRGDQIGSYVGDVIPKANDFEVADIVVCVKRLGPWINKIKQQKKPWVWDLVDFYPQPECTWWTKEYAITWVREKIQQFKPNGIIYPNKQMMKDIGILGEVIYHHHWPNAAASKPRLEVKKVGYEGSPDYIKEHSKLIKKQCDSRGWEFIINPKCLSDVDIVVAFRDSAFNGYTQKKWKSNVKLANAHGFGIPFIGAYESGYLETAHEHDIFCLDEHDLTKAFDYFNCYENRLKAHEAAISSKIDVEECANKLRSYCEKILSC